MSRFRFVGDHRHEYPVKRLCRLAEVSRSGFYSWLRRSPSARAIADQALLVEIERIHRESRCTYGAPRVHGQLARRGVRVGCRRVARLMRRELLVGVNPRSRWRRGRPDIAPPGDLLRRDFRAAKPNQRWVADIAEFPTDEGTLYLAGVRDLCDRSLVGWATGAHPDAELVVDALTMALWRSTPTPQDSSTTPTAAANTPRSTSARPRPSPAPGQLRLHRRLLRQRRDGDLLVDAEREIRWIRGSLRFPTRAAARLYLFEYIEIFYNR